MTLAREDRDSISLVKVPPTRSRNDSDSFPVRTASTMRFSGTPALLEAAPHETRPALGWIGQGVPVQITFEVDDVDADIEHVRQLGFLKYPTIPQDRPWGKQDAGILDPEGNEIYFFQPVKSWLKRGSGTCPGAGGDAWYWHLAVLRLRERGHDVVALSLPASDDSAGWRGSRCWTADEFRGRRRSIPVTRRPEEADAA